MSDTTGEFSEAETALIDASMASLKLPDPSEVKSGRVVIGVLSRIHTLMAAGAGARSTAYCKLASQTWKHCQSVESSKWLIAIFTEQLKSDCSGSKWKSAEKALQRIAQYRDIDSSDPELVFLELNAIMIAVTSAARFPSHAKRFSKTLINRIGGHRFNLQITDLFVKGICAAYVFAHAEAPDKPTPHKKALVSAILDDDSFSIAIQAKDHIGIYLRVLSNAWTIFSELLPSQFILFALARMDIDPEKIPNVPEMKKR